MAKVKSKVLGKEFDYKVRHIGIINNAFGDATNLMDNWLVSINGHEFNYFTGLGHRKLNNFTVRHSGYTLNKIIRSKDVGIINKYTTAVNPSIDDVLYSLCIDSDAANYNLHDWCDNFGYNADSIKANKVYTDCLNNAEKFQKALRVSGVSLLDAIELFNDAEY